MKNKKDFWRHDNRHGSEIKEKKNTNMRNNGQRAEEKTLEITNRTDELVRHVKDKAENK